MTNHRLAKQYEPFDFKRSSTPGAWFHEISDRENGSSRGSRRRGGRRGVGTGDDRCRASWVSADLALVDSQAAAKVEAQTNPKGDTSKPAPAKLGLLLNDPRAYQGYTLIAPMFSKTTYLIDMQGKVVRTWESDYTPGASAYLLENGHLLRTGAHQPAPSGFGPGAGGRVQEFDADGQLLWDFKYVSEKILPHHDVTRLPNGNVLMIVWEKKTKEEVIGAGRRPDMAGNAGLHPDYLIEVKPTGKTMGEIVWEWHLWDHLIQDHDRSKPNFGNISDHPELVDLNFGSGEGPIAPMMATKDGVAKLRSLGYLGSTPAPTAKDAPAPEQEKTPAPEPKEESKPAAKEKSKSGPNQRRPNTSADWTHFNGVAYNADLDQIMVTVRAFSEFWIIDHSTTTAEAASHKGGRSGNGGDLLYRWGNPRAYRNGSKMDQRLFSQHNANWIPPRLPGEGHMLVFNNGSGRPGGDSSSVDELVLPVDSQGLYTRNRRGPYGPTQAVWSYSAPKKSDFYSFFISGSQRLPNGNTLICSGANGTVFEVTPKKEVVWKYTNPVMGNPGGPGGRPGGIDLFPCSCSAPLRPVAGARQTARRVSERDPGGKLDKALNDAQKKQIRELNPFGPAGPAAFPLPGQIISKLTLTNLKPTAEQTKQVDALQKEVDAKLDTLFNADQKKQAKEMRDNPGTFGPPGGGPAGGPGGPPPKGKGGAPTKGQGGPPRGPGGPIQGNTLFRAYRYGGEHPGLAGKALTPGKTIEGRWKRRRRRRTKRQNRRKPRRSEPDAYVFSRLLLLTVILILLAPTPALAYIGPGAGVRALAGSFFAVFAAVCSACLTVLTWPLRLLSRTLFGWRALRRSRVRRVVILGLDGMDYGLSEKMLDQGKLPNLAALRDQGCFKPLGSTVPPISPVAWSTFQTGVNPGKHNIFDFLTPDLHTYRAKLSSVEIRLPPAVDPHRSVSGPAGFSQR